MRAALCRWTCLVLLGVVATGAVPCGDAKVHAIDCATTTHGLWIAVSHLVLDNKLVLLLATNCNAIHLLHVLPWLLFHEAHVTTHVNGAEVIRGDRLHLESQVIITRL